MITYYLSHTQTHHQVRHIHQVLCSTYFRNNIINFFIDCWLLNIINSPLLSQIAYKTTILHWLVLLVVDHLLEVPHWNPMNAQVAKTPYFLVWPLSIGFICSLYLSLTINADWKCVFGVPFVARKYNIFSHIAHVPYNCLLWLLTALKTTKTKQNSTTMNSAFCHPESSPSSLPQPR